MSAFLRAVGTRYEPKTTLGAQAVLNLVNVAGDRGRLGGLLKLWLCNRAGGGASEHDVSQLLNDLIDTQVLLKQPIRSL